MANPQLLLAQQNTQQTNTPTNNNVPPSFKYKLKKKVPVVRADFPASEVEIINRYFAEEKKNGNAMPPTPSYEIRQLIDFIKNAVVEKLPNGDKIWRLKIESNAQIERISFAELDIPNESHFYWYNKQGSDFSSNDKIKYKDKKTIFANYSSDLFLEYYQSKKTKRPHIVIGFVELLYNQSTSSRDEQWYICNPDVQCNIDEPIIHGTETIIPNSPISDFKKQ